jgi:hypothetical protein
MRAKPAAAREDYETTREGHIYVYSQSPDSAIRDDGKIHGPVADLILPAPGLIACEVLRGDITKQLFQGNAEPLVAKDV